MHLASHLITRVGQAWHLQTLDLDNLIYFCIIDADYILLEP